MSKEDWSMTEWRDYYEKLRQRAYMNYQESGMARYDRQELQYGKIVDAFDGYLANKEETDSEKMRRIRNINAYVEQHLYKETYNRNEVLALIRTISTF